MIPHFAENRTSMPKMKPTGKDPKQQQAAAKARNVPPTALERLLGWCVHGYTALGLVAAAIIAVLLVRGGPDAYRWCFLLMALATIVDASDGTLARLVRIKEVVPSFDGRRLDDIIDYLNYTFLPILLIWRADLVPPGQEAWLLVPLVASIYGFCQVQAKTDDGFFLGFPSLWNVVALYLYVLPLGTWTCLAIVLALGVMTFMPSKYLYPSQSGQLNVVATVLGIFWTIPLAYLLWSLPSSTSPRTDSSIQRIALVSLFYPVFYMGVSWTITLSHWSRRSSAS